MLNGRNLKLDPTKGWKLLGTPQATPPAKSRGKNPVWFFPLGFLGPKKKAAGWTSVKKSKRFLKTCGSTARLSSEFSRRILPEGSSWRRCWFTIQGICKNKVLPSDLFVGCFKGPFQGWKVTSIWVIKRVTWKKLEKGSLPSRKLTYPTFGKGKSSSKVPWEGIC